MIGKMKKLSIILAIAIAALSQAQTIANIKIGSPKSSVESVYSDQHSTKRTKTGQTWAYRVNDEFTLTVLIDKNGLVSRVYATGDKDSEGVFESRKGIKLGDSSDKVQKLYGKGQVIGDCEAVMHIKYVNICFTCVAEDGGYKVTMIDVFPAAKPKKTVTKKTLRVSKPEEKIRTKFDDED